MVASETAQLVGSTVGDRYEVLRPLGTESLGQTYVARDHAREGTLVRLKAIAADGGADTETFTRFGREISHSFMVSHPHTVEVLDFGEQDELRYLVSEFLAARTLASELARGALGWERVASIAYQVVQAIGAAHQEGIVHRALSPVSVLLLDNAREHTDFVKVGDFGLSKVLEDVGERDITAAGDRVGPPAYMAPEYIDTGRFGPEADLYALGCLMFEAVTGEPPFKGNRAEVMRQKVEAPNPRLTDRADGLPDWFVELVSALMAGDPAQRPGVRRVLERIEDGLGRSAVPPTPWPLDAEGNVVRAPVEQPGRFSLQPGQVAVVVVFAGLALLGSVLACAGVVGLVWTIW